MSVQRVLDTDAECVGVWIVVNRSEHFYFFSMDCLNCVEKNVTPLSPLWLLADVAQYAYKLLLPLRVCRL